MILKVSDAYLSEYVYKIHEKYKIEMSERFVDRFLSSKDITRKKMLVFFEMTDKLVAKGSKGTLFITLKCLA